MRCRCNALGVAGAALTALGVVVFAFSYSSVAGILALIIVAPLIFFFYVISARVYLELIMVIFRIAENSTSMANQVGRSPSERPLG